MRRFLLTALLIPLAACSLRNVSCGLPPPPPPQTDPSQPVTAASPSPAQSSTLKIAFLGDSLTAGLGLLSNQAYPALIENLFAAEGYREVEIINAGISGDTTAGALRRVEQALDPGVRILVVALGGNDALRGLSTEQTYENLTNILKVAEAKGVFIMLCGMEAPSNLGEDYREKFREAFARLSREHRKGMTFVPFLLQGVAGMPALNQPDGIHPNEQGARVIAEALYPKLRDIIDQIAHVGG
jgi:acyl-CoA thioesterase I